MWIVEKRERKGKRMYLSSDLLDIYTSYAYYLTSFCIHFLSHVVNQHPPSLNN